jgi:putative ABC transport system ATP-binding protein
MPSKARPAIARIISFLRGDWNDIGVIIVYAIGVGLASLGVPIAAKSLVNSVAFGALLQPLIVLTSLVFGVLLFSGFMQVLQQCVAENLQRRLIVRIAMSLAQRIPQVRYAEFRKKYGADHVLRFAEAFAAQKAVKGLLLDGLAVLFQTFTGVILLAFYHPFFLAFSIVMVVCISIIILPFTRVGVSTSIRESDAKYELFAWLQDLASTPVLFKSSRGESLAIRRSDELTRRYLNRRRSHFSVLLTQNIGGLLLQAIGSASLLGLGGYLVINQQLTLGQLVAAELIITLVLSSVTKLGKHIETFYDLSASIAKLDALMELPKEEVTGSFFGVDEQPARLDIRKLQFRFGEGDSLIKDLTLSLAAGDKLAIWGANGSGKSLVANAIYRLVNPTSGWIEIDGHNVSEIHPRELRSEVVLLRGLELFHGTVTDNLTLGHPSILPSEVQDALKMVGLLNEIRSLPEGMNTWLKGTAQPLSRGQGHQLMIARAILQRPRLLILDGSLDSIDEIHRKTVLSSLITGKTPWTLLVFTHDDEVLCEFPRSYQLTNGTIVSLTPGARHV